MILVLATCSKEARDAICWFALASLAELGYLLPEVGQVKLTALLGDSASSIV